MTTKDGLKRYAIQRGASALVALTLSGGLADAQSPTPDAISSGMAAVSAALGHMKAGGTPLVVVVTSAARPESRAFFRTLIDGPWARANRGLVQIVELPAEDNAATVERLRIATYPSVLAYTAGREGPLCRGVKAGVSADEAAAWLGSLGIGDARMAAVTVDPAVAPAMHDGYPSPQQANIQAAPPAPSPNYIPASVPTYTQAPVAYTPAALPSPTYMIAGAPAAPPAATASFVQVPGPNVVVQQGEARVFLAPPSGTASIAGMPSAPSPTSNLFLPASVPAPTMAYIAAAPAPAAIASYVPAAPPTAYYPAAAPAAFAPAALPSVAAVTNTTTALPTMGSRTRTRVRGPGPIRSGLASLGERMVQLGRARIETIQETELNTPAVQGGGGVATFTTSSTIPLAPTQSTSYVPASAPPQQAPPPQAPPPVYSAPPITPTPQAAPHKHGGLFR